MWVLGAIALQMAILAGVLVGATYPLYTGQAVRLQVEPVDPRSLFRGNYARLSYVIGRVHLDATLPGLRIGEMVYVSLVEGSQGIMQANGVSLEQPNTGQFIRGRVTSSLNDDAIVRIRYGIEAYFLPRDEALAMEKALRKEKVVANVMLASNGKAALVDVLPAAEP